VCDDVGWIHLAQVRDQWWALINMLMNFRVSLNMANFLTSSTTISFTVKIPLRLFRVVMLTFVDTF
jgi:hypothetical protein